MSYTPYAGQQSCGKFDFKVGYIGPGATHPQSGSPIPSSSSPSDYITGVTMKIQDDKERIRSINDLYVDNVKSNPQRLSYNIGFPNHEGTLRTMSCPSGYAVSGMKVWGDDKTGRVQLICKNLFTGSEIMGPAYGSYSNAGNPKTIKCGNMGLATSIEGSFNQDSSGSSGDRLCPIKLGCKDYTQEFYVLRNDPGKLGCCLGQFPSSICGNYQPGKSGCELWMADYCKRNPSAPECACINSPVAKSGKYNPLCVDAKCIQTGYQPANMIQARGSSCPPITECNMIFDMKQNYGLINFQDAQFEQNCMTQVGGVSTPATGQAKLPVVPQPTTPPAYNLPSSTKYDPNIVLFIVITFILFIFIAMFIVIIYSYSGSPTS
jgi:hypothetical protein